MPTIGEAIRAIEAELFVGRRDELARFRDWLAARSSTAQPEILNVHGAGGLGKSALMRSFARVAEGEGRPVILLDGEVVEPTPEAFCRASGEPDAESLVRRLNNQRPLFIIDSFGSISALTHFLQTEILEDLEAEVPVTIGTRTSLKTAWGASSVWGKLIRPIQLESLRTPERNEYLKRRGIDDERLIEDIVTSVGGFPLGLSLAADMVVELGIRQLPDAAEWHLVVQSLVNRLLNDVTDQDLRALLDVCAIVRQFDEVLLSEVADLVDAPRAFDRLCSLSVVRPAEHGLMLHEDVSRMLADNLRWRDQERFEHLRSRALAHYRRRALTATSEERAWLVAERFYLWQDSLIQKLFFVQDSPGRIWMDTGRPDDLEAIIRIWFEWLNAIPTPDEPAEGELEEEKAWVERFLRLPGLRLRVFRDAEGEVTGFSTIMPVYKESAAFLESHSYRGAVVTAYLRAHPEAELEEEAKKARTSYLFQLSVGGREPEASYAAILRDSVGYFAQGGVLLAATIPQTHRALTAAMGFVDVPNSTSVFRGLPIQGQILDLDKIGVEQWLEAVVQGRRPPEPLSRSQFEKELQDVLLNWRDDSYLAGSRLAALTESSIESAEGLIAGKIREVIQTAITTALETAGDDQRLAYRAVQLAYIDKLGSHELVAERLAVSRSTFYRLLKRGVAAIAERFHPA